MLLKSPKMKTATNLDREYPVVAYWITHSTECMTWVDPELQDAQHVPLSRSTVLGTASYSRPLDLHPDWS